MRTFLHHHPKWFLAAKVAPFVLGILAVKLLFHFFGVEVLSLSPLLTSLIAATVFLLGFLVSGTLADYKESEKLPGEMAACIEAIADECRILRMAGKAEAARACLSSLSALNACLLDWFLKKERSKDLMRDIDGLSAHFFAFEPLTQANFIVRLKQEQNTLRKCVIRAHTIRETSFVSAGYTVAELVTGALLLALVAARVEPFYESLALLGVVSFLLLYMLLLIKDLDNPFSHYEERVTSSVSLKPLRGTKERLEEEMQSV